MHESSRTTRVLQPPRPRFILSTLALAFFWDLIPKGGGGFWPEMTMAVLTFWALRDPQRVGVGAAFTLGVMLDSLSCGWFIWPSAVPHASCGLVLGGRPCCCCRCGRWRWPCRPRYVWLRAEIGPGGDISDPP